MAAVFASVVTMALASAMSIGATPAAGGSVGPARTTPERAIIAQAGGERVTASFELEEVGALLRKLAQMFDGGLSRADAERIAAEIDAMDVDAERVWSFAVTYRRSTAQLAIRARVDDLSMVDFDFRTAPQIASEMRRVLDDFRDERER